MWKIYIYICIFLCGSIPPVNPIFHTLPSTHYSLQSTIFSFPFLIVSPHPLTSYTTLFQFLLIFPPIFPSLYQYSPTPSSSPVAPIPSPPLTPFPSIVPVRPSHIPSMFPLTQSSSFRDSHISLYFLLHTIIIRNQYVLIMNMTTIIHNIIQTINIHYCTTTLISILFHNHLCPWKPACNRVTPILSHAQDNIIIPNIIILWYANTITS